MTNFFTALKIIFRAFFITFQKKIGMKFYLIICLVIFSLISLGCRTDSQDNSRIFVEGKIKENTITFEEINIILKSDHKTIAETIPESSGEFKLSGPLISDSFSLEFNKKIKSFSASKNGCTLSPNALEIRVPAGITYLIFNEIILE